MKWSLTCLHPSAAHKPLPIPSTPIRTSPPPSEKRKRHAHNPDIPLSTSTPFRSPRSISVNHNSWISNADAIIDAERALLPLPPARESKGEPPRLALGAILHPPRIPGTQSVQRPPITLRTLSQPPHFPYSLSVLGALVAPIASHNERRCDDAFWTDSAAVRAKEAERRSLLQERKRGALASGQKLISQTQTQSQNQGRDSLYIPLAHPWKSPTRNLTRPKRYCTLEPHVAYPHATFGERYYLWRGRYPVPDLERGEVRDDPGGQWAVFCADVDSVSRRGTPPASASSALELHSASSVHGEGIQTQASEEGPADLRFYSSEEAWLLLESHGWGYSPTHGRLYDTGASSITSLPLEADDPALTLGEKMDGSACDERLGGMWWQGQQKLVSVLGEWSQFRRPLRINSISQLWVPTIRKIMSYQRIRPSTMQVTYFTRWVLPPQAEVLRVDDDEEAGWVEREMGMRLGRLTRREVGELSGPLRQTPRYITHGLAFSSVARPLSPSSSSASSVLYGASTLNTDLSLTSPLLLPSYAFSPLPQILLGRTARAVYRSLTQTRDEHGQSKTALSSLLPQSLPLHAKIPISDRATAAVLRASGWKEVFGGVADVFLDGWTDTPEEEYQEQKAEKRTGMTRAQREELGERRKRQAEENWRLAQEDREIEQGLAPGGDGARGVMQRRERMRVGMSGVFSHPDKIDTWDV